jgi:hypothetical protein
MRELRFGYAGKWSPNFPAVQQAAQLVKSDPTPVGVEAFYQSGMPLFRVATNQEYYQAAQGGRLIFTALA